MEDKKSESKRPPQQHQEDTGKQNAQQEREYREQKEGSVEKIKKQPTKDDAIETYKDIKTKQKKEKGEEE